MLHVNFQRTVGIGAQALGTITDRVTAKRIVGEEGATFGCQLVEGERPEGPGRRQLAWLETQHVAASTVERLAGLVAGATEVGRLGGLQRGERGQRDDGA